MKLFNRNKEIIQLEQMTQLTFAEPIAATFQTNEAAEFALQQICCKGLLQVLLPMGLEKKQPDWSRSKLANAMGVLAKYDRLFIVLVDALTQAGFTTETAEGILVTEQTKLEIKFFKLENAIQQLVAEDKAYEPHGNLVKVCIQSLQAILTGTISATEVIFPGGSLELVTGIYQGNYGADFFNGLLANMVAASVSSAIEHLPEGEKIKILEVGAGTGGSSEVIFKKLDAYKSYIEYVFTDVSKSFLIYAEDKFKTGAPYLQTALFNIEQSPRIQNLAIGGYDLVIGANVVHATKNIAATLANIKALLKKDGLLMLSEIAKADIFTSLSFGLLDGWWLYEDQELRLEGSPGLSAANWQMVLTEAGFNEPSSWPLVADLSQQIIVAKSDGMVVLNTVSGENPDQFISTQRPQGGKAKPGTAAQANAEKYLQSIFATVLKMEASAIDIHAPFESLGIDSLMIGSLTKAFSKDFGAIPATTFFEYRNISELCEYFLENYADFFAPKELETAISTTIKIGPEQNNLPIVEQLKTVATTEAKGETAETDIAIIGLSGRYPGAKNVTEFWNNLKAGKDSITEIPKNRWDIDAYFNEEKGIEGKISSRFGGFIDGVAEFDPLFFNISPKEAERMDPQERLFLQTVWETIEDAGYTTNQLSNKKNDGVKTGVYVGVMYEEYQLLGVKTTTASAVVVGGSMASIANRVSYCCDFSGPSMAVDTMCSSSLTAIHLACKDLLSGEADVAIAGGVNVSIHPNKYLALSQATFLSTKGKCESFGNGGDGFIPGEGVGAVLLKPLNKAVADGDHIYGIIKASAINHGGKTNGYTVPSPRGQASVVKEAIQKAGVKAADFTYIEAHGTGTSLGDPIEMAGLIKAFGTDKKQFCSIGSVKSNIGHCESAAGISGLTKILLQLQHKQLVPSLHSAELNPSIDFINSPFKVQQQLAEWTTANNQPRLAGISSFGAGGSNAHIIIQEYPQTIKNTPLSSPAIILLSAKNKDRLAEQVANLQTYLLENKATNLADMAFTLQIGREQMVERLAIVATDKESLTEKLTTYLDGKTEGIFTGNIKKEKADIFITGKAGEAYIKEAIRSKEPESLAQLWVKGVAIDWALLYIGDMPNKISLPTYPFAKEHYWITKTEVQKAVVENVKLHPLLHSNTSTLREQKYTSLYNGHESFLQDHQVKGMKILPGVAYLEMARAAAAQSVQQKITQLKDITWLTPIHVNGTPQEVQISLYELTANEIGFEIFTQKTGEEQLHSEGKIYTTEQTAPQNKDIDAILQRLERSTAGAECYRLLAEKGLNYGTSFQGIETLYYSETESLSKINLKKEEGYIMQPGLLDSALQTCVGMSFAQKDGGLSLPFSLKEVTIYGELPTTLWCYATKSSSTKSNGVIVAYDVDLINLNGEVLLTIRDFATLPMGDKKEELKKIAPVIAAPKIKEAEGDVLYIPIWERMRTKEIATIANGGGKHLLVTGHLQHDAINALKKVLANNNIEAIENVTIAEAGLGITDIYFLQGLFVNAADISIEKGIEEREIAVFNNLKAFIGSGYRDKPLNITLLTAGTQKVLSTDKVKSAGAGIVGLAGSLAKEYPLWKLRVVDVEEPLLSTPVLEKVLAMPFDKEGAVQAYRRGFTYQRGLSPVQLASKASQFRMYGTYVILGGAGGIGKVTTAHLVSKYKAKVIWLGKTALNEKISASLDEIEQLGARPMYISCDANDKQAMESAYGQIKNVYNEVHGLFHSAIVLNDMLMMNMDEAGFKKSFMPKSLASHHLTEAFKTEPLDFICYYSSAQSQINAPGQANYSAGCTYKDSFAQSWEAQSHVPSFIINWGYWGEVGVVASQEYREQLELMGVGSISAVEGMDILERILNSDQRQVMAIKLLARSMQIINAIDPNKKYIEAAHVSNLNFKIPQLASYQCDEQAEAAFRQLCGKGLLQVLLEMDFEEKQAYGIENSTQLRRALGILDRHERLFNEMMRAEVEIGYLEKVGNKYTVSVDLKEELMYFDLGSAVDELVFGNKEYEPHANLLKVCLQSMKEILTGKIAATSVMFPKGRLDLVMGIYKGNYQTDYFNDLLAAIIERSVSASVPNLQAGEKIRILEVGAGTGGSSEVIFKKLTPHKEHVEYTYTDLSKSFLFHAEDNFKAIAPYLKTALFNIEQSPKTQNLELGAYDLVIGANVVHATKNIAHTLSNIKAVLKKDGLLIMNELAQNDLFPTLTFGLLDGWWLYEDVELRLEGSPGLPAASWKTVVNEIGFTEAVSFPTGVNAGQQIVMAKSNGTIKLLADKPIEKPAAVAVVTNLPANNTHKKMDSAWLMDQLITIASETIKLPKEEFDVEEKFMDYGFDSILGNTLMKNINETLDISLKPTDIFNYPNIAQLSVYILETYGDKMAPTTLHLNAKANDVAVPEATEAKAPEEKKWKHRATKNIGNDYLAAQSKDIAIIGISGQFGSANNTEEFWNALKEGRSLIEEAPAERWDVNKYYSADRDAMNKTYCKWGGFLSDIDKFDPRFFKISGSEAENMDPQQRFFLQHCWSAIEDAGMHPQQLKGSKCGVYVGAGPSDYMASMNGAAASAMWGNSSSILASRISYLLDLHGPAISIDTACSSSLVAMNMGCSSLQSGDTDVIICGGVTVMSSINFYTVASRAGMLSADGKCYAFDSRANGFVPGEGVGVVLMKRLEDAERDGDHIYGVIKGSLTNQDGTTNGILAPSAISQQELEKKVYTKFNIHPETISYVEAHGTGTSLGDPIEFQALAGSFGSFTQKKNFCGLGSVKTNTGHTLMAAGVAGMIKILLALKHQQLPPTINYKNQNPLIDLANSPFKIQEKLEAWPSVPGQLRRAAISSFGFSGTNAHMIVEEYKPAFKHVYTANGAAVVVLSAKNSERLNKQVSQLKTFLEANEAVNIYDIAYTLQTGREAMEERLAVVVNNTEELSTQLTGFLNGIGCKVLTGNGKKDNSGISLKDDAGKTFLQNAIKNNELLLLAELWLKGAAIDWNLLYATQKPQKISLPAYPFAKERFWAHKTEEILDVTEPAHVADQIGASAVSATENSNSLSAFAIDDELESANIISRAEIVTQLIGIFSKGLKLPKEEFGEEVDLQEYGIDSILTMQLLQMAEDHFLVEIDIDDLMAGRNIADLATIIEGKLKNNNKQKVTTDKAEKLAIAVELNPNELFKTQFAENYATLLPHTKTRFIKYKGINLEVLLAGSGKETVVMLPPIDSTATAWMGQFQELQKKYKIVVPHYPGYGMSEFKPLLATLSEIANGVMFVVKELGIKTRVHLVGWSMGGFIAQILAERFPERLKSITLVNTTSKLEEASTVSNGNLMFEILRKDFVENGPRLEKTPFANINQSSIKGSFNNQVSMFYALQVLEHDYRSYLADIKVPVLIIAGGKDKLSPPHYAKFIHQEIEGSEYVELKSAQHYIPLFHAQFFNRQLLKFLEENKVVKRIEAMV